MHRLFPFRRSSIAILSELSRATARQSIFDSAGRRSGCQAAACLDCALAYPSAQCHDILVHFAELAAGARRAGQEGIEHRVMRGIRCIRVLRPRRDPGRPLDALECRSAADRGARRAGGRGRARPRRRRPRRLGGDRADGVVFVSPLCALSSALFSARVLHHVLLIAAVAPLLALAFPLRRLGSPPLAALVGVHAVILWLWHAPGPYAWGLASVPAYWLMQISLARQRLAPVAGDPRAGDAAGPGAGRAGRDDRADGASGRVDRLRAAAALSRCISRARPPGDSARSPISSSRGS